MEVKPPKTTPERPLEPSPEAMRRLIHQAAERIIHHIETLPEQKLHNNQDGPAVARALVEPLPETGTPIEALLDLLDRTVPCSYNTASPGYLAYVPGGGLYASAVADFLADGYNRYTGAWVGSPGLVQLEVNVLRWIAELLGYPATAKGFLSTGGSIANFTAVVTARMEKLPENFLDGTLYCSDQIHHSVLKAARLAGFPAANVRQIPCDDHFRLRLDLLEGAMDEDRAAGLKPFLVITSGGTTNTGAVDDLTTAAEICHRHGVWHHVDAAYGGFFVMTERGKKILAGIELADSITLDPHKSLFLPYGTGCLLVRDGDALRRTHAVDAQYMPVIQEDPDFWDFHTLSPELSRDFRGLRVWLPLKLHGAAAFRDALDEKLDMAHEAADALRAIPEIDVVAEPQLSILAFRLLPTGSDEASDNALNRRFLERINARQRIFITATTIDGRFLLRICALSFRTTPERMRLGLDDIRAAAAEVLNTP